MGQIQNVKRKILVASTNPGKLAELRAMLDADVEWAGLADFPGIGEVEEDGATFAENARKKACGYAREEGLRVCEGNGALDDCGRFGAGCRCAWWAAGCEIGAVFGG